MADTLVAYNPSDQWQQAFLSSLALGESGNAANAATLGVGGTDLSGAPVDQYGFPQWSGQGNSHAAGIYQFQPGTWKEVASRYGLDFRNVYDQSAGAWYYAQQVYEAKTGSSLEEALHNGEYMSVQNALRFAWPSVQGNAAAPEGLARNIASGTGSKIADLATSAWNGAVDTVGGWFGHPLDTAQNYFVRGGLILVGALILLVALWALLSHYDMVPNAVSLGGDS